VVVGCVLEDALRKLCAKAKLSPPSRKMDAMNATLAKAGIYNKLKAKDITAWAGLRNEAAHGNWDQFTDEDVKRMLDGVRQFVTEHPVP